MVDKKYPVITLCGSTRFKDKFLQVQKELTLKGWIVLSVGLFGHSGDDEVWEKGTKEMLDDHASSKNRHVRCYHGDQSWKIHRRKHK